jgi:hypothetical protein
VVVPAGPEPAVEEDLVRVARLRHEPVRADLVDELVVEEDERRLQPGDDEVLVGSRIGDDRRAVGVARKILERAAGAAGPATATAPTPTWPRNLRRE